MAQNPTSVTDIINALPEGTARVRLLVRHTHSVQTGPQNTRTITKPGVELCERVKSFYHMLVNALCAQLDMDPSFVTFDHSPLPRALLTLWYAFGMPEQMSQSGKLMLYASLKKVAGNWYEARKAEGLSLPQILAAFIADPSLWEGQPFRENVQEYTEWVHLGDHEVGVGVVHEPIASLAAAEQELPADQLGLNELQAYLFCLDAGGLITAVIKVLPEGTEL